MGVLIPAGIQDYARADLPRVVLSNVYAESSPPTPGQTILLPRPALQKTGSLGTGPGRGCFQADGLLNGAQLVVSGTTLYSNGVAVGTIPGTDLVQMIWADAFVVIIANGAYYRFDGTTLIHVTMPNGEQVASACYLGTYTFVTVKGANKVYFTLDTSTFAALDYFITQQSTEPIVGVGVFLDMALFFCERHTEMYYLSGDSNAPLYPVQGRVFDKGARSRDAIVRFDNTLAWVGNDNVVYRLDIYPTRISGHGIEEQLANSTACSAWAYPHLGHLFFVLQLDGQTLAYDAATQQWHELKSFNAPRWRALTGLITATGVLAVDDIDGTIWTLDENQYQDNADPIIREWTVKIDEPAILDNLILMMSNANNGLVEMAVSRDGGQTFGSWRQAYLGADGRFRTRVAFRRIGLVDAQNALVRFRLSDNVPSRLSYVRANDPLGGRSR